MAFDFTQMMTSPSFQMGLGLLGAARPRNRPLLDAYQMLNQMQQQRQEQEKVKQYLELQQAQEERLKTQSKLYERQVMTAEEAAKRKAAQDEFFQKMLPGLMQQFGGGQAPVAPIQQTPAQPAAPVSEVGKYGTPKVILDNLEQAESSGNAYAVGPDIGKGVRALGAYQFLPSTVQQLKMQGLTFNPFDKEQSRDAADFYLQKLAEKHGGDYNKALAEYGGFKTKDPAQYVSKVLQGYQPPTSQPQQQPAQATPSGIDQYRQLQALAGIAKGMGGDVPGALEGFAKAGKPETYTPGAYVNTPQGMTRIPNPEEQERLRNDAERLRLEKERLVKPPEGYERLPNGELKAIKGGPAEAKLTEAEGKATTYYDQMTTARGVLEGLEKQGWDPKSTLSQVGTALAGGITNPAATAMQQQAKQAQEQWAEAYLRFKTGAATNADEIARNVRTFFPQVGDKAETVKQKEKARKDAEASIAISAGRGLAKLPQRASGTYADPEKERRYQEWKARQGQ